MDTDLVAVGQIFSIFGIKGQLKVRPLSEFFSRFKQGSKVILDDKEITIINASKQKHFYILQFDICDTPEKGKLLRNKFIYVNQTQVPKQNPDNYYYFELIGISVFGLNQNYLGKVTTILNTGANDVYVVTNENNKEILVPAIKSVIFNIDIRDQKMIIDQPTWL
tara:strand:+ start:120 stop:614 length:495 start_codon:yes stop_codon:yes gene_type:complete